MAAPATVDDIEALRAEVRELRDEMNEMRRTLGIPEGRRRPRRSLEERMASLERMRQVSERILAERGGEMLPPIADEIRAMREERAEEILQRVICAAR